MRPYHTKLYDQEKDQPKAETPAPVPDLDRFQLESFRAGMFLCQTVILVRDTLTNRVRESTHDLADAQAIAARLNAGLCYAGGELVS